MAKVLIIEDNPDNMKLISWIMEDEGHEITCAFDAESGLSYAENNVFDIVLMDISLPGMDGMEATRRLRKNDNYRTTPIIALTAHAVVGEEEAILNSGVDTISTKPIDEQEFLQVLQKYLHKTGHPDG